MLLEANQTKKQRKMERVGGIRNNFKVFSFDDCDGAAKTWERRNRARVLGGIVNELNVFRTLKRRDIRSATENESGEVRWRIKAGDEDVGIIILWRAWDGVLRSRQNNRWQWRRLRKRGERGGGRIRANGVLETKGREICCSRASSFSFWSFKIKKRLVGVKD